MAAFTLARELTPTIGQELAPFLASEASGLLIPKLDWTSLQAVVLPLYLSSAPSLKPRSHGEGESRHHGLFQKSDNRWQQWRSCRRRDACLLLLLQLIPQPR